MRRARGSRPPARFPAQVGRDGVVIPTLAEVIALAERRSLGRIRYNIEIKTAPDDPAASSPERVAEALVTLVRRSGIAARTTIQSFDWRSLAHVHAIAPELRRSCLTADSNVGPDKITWTAGLDPATHGSVPRLVHAFGCDVWSPDADTVTPAAIAEAHRLELLVIPWTVNRPAEIERLLAVGVDGVITDVPDRLPRR
jgi:glycerophosphoryl diester phosphodiesterase